MSTSTSNGERLRIHCAICQGYHPVKNTRGLPCGHIFCDTGLARYFQTLPANQRRLYGRACPTCRKPLKQSDSLLSLFFDACFAVPGDSSDIIYEADASSEPPTGVPSAHESGGYAAEVHRRAQQVVECIKALDGVCSVLSVQRVANHLTRVVNRMPADEDDKIQVLLSSLVGYFRDAICKVFGVVREKERLVEEAERRRAKLKHEVEALSGEAVKREQVLEEAIATADRAASEVTRLKGEVQRLEAAKQADKQKMAALQNSAELAKSTERRLRRKVEDLEVQLQTATAELETQRESAEQQRQENEDLRQQSQLDYAYPYDDASQADGFAEYGSEFVEGSSQARTWETSSVAYVDLDSPPSRSSTPTRSVSRSASRSSRVPSTAASCTRSTVRPLKPIVTSNPRTASSSAAAPRPKFTSDWSFPAPSSKRKRSAADEDASRPFFPIKTDSSGRPVGQLQVGPRTKLNKYN